LESSEKIVEWIVISDKSLEMATLNERGFFGNPFLSRDRFLGKYPKIREAQDLPTNFMRP